MFPSLQQWVASDLRQWGARPGNIFPSHNFKKFWASHSRSLHERTSAGTHDHLLSQESSSCQEDHEDILFYLVPECFFMIVHYDSYPGVRAKRRGAEKEVVERR